MELGWLRKRLDSKRREYPSARSDGQQDPKPAFCRPVSVENLNVLQLRRVLRTLERSTRGLKAELGARLGKAVSSGVAEEYLANLRAQSRTAECAAERRKNDAVAALVEGLLESRKEPQEVTPKRAPCQPEASTHEKQPMVSSPPGKSCIPLVGRKLSGPEQDAVVAKIRSEAQKSASPAKKLPFEDDDTPNSKGARLKKEMEERLARQNQLKKARALQASSAGDQSPGAMTPSTPPPLRPTMPASPPPAPAPSVEAEPDSREADTAAANRSPVGEVATEPGSQAASTSAEAPQAVSASEAEEPSAPQEAAAGTAEVAETAAGLEVAQSAAEAKEASDEAAGQTERAEPEATPAMLPPEAPPAPEVSAPRPLDAEVPPAPCVEAPVARDEPVSEPPVIPEAPSSEAPVPAEVARSQEVSAAVASCVPSSVAVDTGGANAEVQARGREQEGGGGSGGSNSSSKREGEGGQGSKAFGSPVRSRSPVTKTTPGKANRFANQSISQPETGSPPKAAAHEALDREAKEDTEAPSPSSGSTTQNAFAKFRAMDAAGKKSPGPGLKRISPYNSPKSSPSQMFGSNRSDAGGVSGQPTTPNKFELAIARREREEKLEREAAAAAAKAKAEAEAREAAAAANRVKAAMQADRERAEALQRAKEKARAEEEQRKAKAKAEEEQRKAKAKAEEEQRKARARAEAKIKEAARKAALEREAKLKAAAEEEARAEAAALRAEEERRKAAKRAAVAAALAEAEAAAEAAAAAEKRKKEEEAAAIATAALKRAQQAANGKGTKPPTPPRTSTKAPPPPPRPGEQNQAPPTPPRPPSVSSSAPSYSTPPPAVASGSTPTPPSQSVKKDFAHKIALEKKKQEIAKRMEELRNKQISKATSPGAAAGHGSPAAGGTAPAATAPVAKVMFEAPKVPAPAPPSIPSAAPAPATASAPAGNGKGNGSKEERESYDAYDVEPGSGSESCEEEEPAQEIVEPQETTDNKAAMPDWARGKSLAKILDRQFGGPNPINPDTIFPEFFTCNLEHIFNTKKSKWDRGSSGNWHTDRLTIAEKLAYQRAMGFTK